MASTALLIIFQCYHTHNLVLDPSTHIGGGVSIGAADALGILFRRLCYEPYYAH